jgi:hypothetical protein
MTGVVAVPFRFGSLGTARGPGPLPRWVPAVLGASASPAEIGSEARPICWLATLLAAIETPAAIRTPRIARPIQRADGGSLIAPA